jgi:hypothetical protein
MGRVTLFDVLQGKDSHVLGHCSVSAYHVMGSRGSPPATPGKISSLPEPLTEQICVLCCSCTSRALRGSFRHVAVRPWGAPERRITVEGALGRARQSLPEVTGSVA